MTVLPLNVLYYGQEDPLPEQRDLQAGPLSATFEQGQLLNIRWRGREILRRIYVAVRDCDWGDRSSPTLQPPDALGFE